MADLLTKEERDQVKGPIERTKLELLLRKTPYIIKRVYPNGNIRLITVQEML
jgi:hypothetical protein